MPRLPGYKTRDVPFHPLINKEDVDLFRRTLGRGHEEDLRQILLRKTAGLMAKEFAARELRRFGYTENQIKILWRNPEYITRARRSRAQKKRRKT